jgi:4'-phosphopantetheinyl transferase
MVCDRPSPCLWQLPPQPLQLLSQEVHLWFVNLDQAPSLEILKSVLAPEERSRADRFYTEQLSHRFAAGRAMLRGILGYYLQQDPQTIVFAYGDRGKPELAQKLPYQFNLSHSHQFALYGMSQHPLGVDLETLRPLPAVLNLAERFFAPGEFEVLRELPETERSLMFFRYWVCKEAYVKAIGQGLAHQLNQIEIGFNPVATLRPTMAEGRETLATQDWSLREITPDSQTLTAAAVVVATEDCQFRYWQGNWDFLV